MMIDISPEECEELVNLVSTELGNTKIEVRHTKKAEWRTELHKEEELLKNLLEKLQTVTV
jgi:hypothetical protein